MYRQLLKPRGGIIRTSELIAAGLSRYRIGKELEAGRLQRVRKGWVALPDADPELLRAAHHGLMLSCITHARHIGLWVRDDSIRHYAVPRAGAERRPPQARLHYRRPVVPRPPYSLSDALPNSLVCIAHCQTFEDAVATWDSALNKQLISYAEIARLPISRAARNVLAATSPFADSGLESYVRIRLRWLRVPLRSQTWIHGHRVDFLIGDRLVLQIDGSTHTGRQRTSDNRHDAILQLNGYRVIRVGYAQIMHHWHEVQDLIMRAVAAGLHRTS